jgi:hypothetical protein
MGLVGLVVDAIVALFVAAIFVCIVNFFAPALFMLPAHPFLNELLVLSVALCLIMIWALIVVAAIGLFVLIFLVVWSLI